MWKSSQSQPDTKWQTTIFTFLDSAGLMWIWSQCQVQTSTANKSRTEWGPSESCRCWGQRSTSLSETETEQNEDFCKKIRTLMQREECVERSRGESEHHNMRLNWAHRDKGQSQDLRESVQLKGTSAQRTPGLTFEEHTVLGGNTTQMPLFRQKKQETPKESMMDDAQMWDESSSREARFILLSG